MDNLADLTGKTLGKYRILKRLGRGGMAEVYQAHQTTLDRLVALKVILPFLTSDPDFLKRFEREAKNVAALRHPNIIQVFDFDVENGLPYMVMEYVEGDTLKGLLEKMARRGQPLPLAQAVRLAREIGQALGFAHKQGVIHRDVKPSNVMIDKSGRVILTDFGVAKMVDSQTLTASGAATGTPAYMSPEQALGGGVDQRADLYALGVILYQLVTGQVPFEADTPLAVMLKQVHDVRPSPRRLRPELPEGLERVILKSMAREPAERFQSAEELIDYLNNPGAAAQLAVPASATLPGDPALLAAFRAAPPPEAATLPPTPPAARPQSGLPPTPSAGGAAGEPAGGGAITPGERRAGGAAEPPQDVGRTLGHTLKEIACYHCTGAGLELEPDGRARCPFCGEVNSLAGPACPQCETVNAASAELCLNCNTALTRACPACEARNWSGAERCVRCGRQLDTLSALIDRAGDAGERFHKERRELAAVSAREAESARDRLAHLEAIDRRRLAAIQDAQRRKAREQQIALAVAAVIVVITVAGLAVILLWR